MTASVWRWIPCQAGSAAWNMALDEALLESVSRLSTPVVRFYGWTEPAASFGYFQHYADVEALTALRPLVRRPTGGGIVPHDADWTYSAVFPPCHMWYGLKAIESYRRIHEFIRLAFLQLDVETILAPAPNKSLPGQCFAGYEQFDVLYTGRKIAGASQRRNRQGLLIQGSIQPPGRLARSTWETALLEGISGVDQAEFSRFDASEIHARAEQLAAEKFSQDSYNRRR